MDDITIGPIDGAAAHAAVDELAAVLVDCVGGGASVNFLAPFGLDDARIFWRRVADEVTAHRAVLLVARLGGVVVGTTIVQPASQPNQPHRAEIGKVLVHRSARRRGLAASLMTAAESTALALGRTLLMLDTEQGGDAERLYERLGWQRWGVVPDFALSPTGVPCAAVFFYKRLDVTPLPPRSER